MAVARHSTSAARIPNHMPQAATGAPYEAWMKNVSQRNAPGAISAMAFTVRPVNPRVARVVGGFSFSAIHNSSFVQHAFRRFRLLTASEMAITRTGRPEERDQDCAGVQDQRQSFRAARSAMNASLRGESAV